MKQKYLWHMGGMEGSFTHILILGTNWRQVATFMLQLLGKRLVSIEYRTESFFGCFEKEKLSGHCQEVKCIPSYSTI